MVTSANTWRVEMSDESLTAAEMGAKGGRARAESLTPEERSEMARAAVQARWAKEKEGGLAIPKATHEGILCIGSIEIPCAVLEGRTRVLTQSGFMLALGRARQAKGRQYYDG